MANTAEYQRQWRQKNPGKYTEYCKRWKSKNPELAIQSAANWRSNNQDSIVEYNKKYVKENLSDCVARTRNRRARLKNIEGVHTGSNIKSLLESQHNLCAGCNKFLVHYDVDHILPLIRGGSNWPSNLQILCPTCNRSKSKKTMEEWEEYKQIIRNKSKNG